MKEPYMHTIIGSTGRDSGLIILLQLYGSKFGVFKIIFLWVGQYFPPPPHWTFILEEKLIQY